ncbi:MAG: translation elongation factor Ts [Bacteroidales bacterium]|nr:translation elongation factor Ts [Bacteroidales bacterium]
MAVTIADINKLRKMTGAGIMDCKKALVETNNDIDAAIEIIRKKGLAIAAKREDRDSSEGRAIAGTNGTFAAVVSLKCETDFVANTDGFKALANQILEAALANKAQNIDELKAIKLGDRTIAELIVEETGKTGEKMEIGAYEAIEAAKVVAYNHFNGKLATIVGFNKDDASDEATREIALQVASMNPVAVNVDEVPETVKQQEMAAAIDKTKLELVKKAVDNALTKAGLNPNLVDSEDHIASNINKGWLTEEEAAKAREIKEKTAAEKAANMPEAMIQNIAKGRLNKFFKDNVLMEQELGDTKETVSAFLQKIDKDLVVTSFKRVNLNADN